MTDYDNHAASSLSCPFDQNLERPLEQHKLIRKNSFSYHRITLPRRSNVLCNLAAHVSIDLRPGQLSWSCVYPEGWFKHKIGHALLLKTPQSYSEICADHIIATGCQSSESNWALGELPKAPRWASAARHPNSNRDKPMKYTGRSLIFVEKEAYNYRLHRYIHLPSGNMSRFPVPVSSFHFLSPQLAFGLPCVDKTKEKQ